MKNWKQILGGLGILIALALLVSAIYLGPGFLLDADKNSLNSKSEHFVADQESLRVNRQAILFAAGGLIAVVTLWFTWLRDQTGRAKLELDREANRSTRYTEAVRQIGDASSVAIRLGGVYSLEQIATESEHYRDIVFQLLAGFVRNDGLERRKAGTLGEDDEVWESIQPEDVRAALTVVLAIHEQTDLKLNLDGADLRETDWDAGTYKDGNFIQTDWELSALAKIRFDKSIFTGSSFNYSTLKYLHFNGSLLGGTYFEHAECLLTDFSDCIFDGSVHSAGKFHDCTFPGASFYGANLRGAAFTADTEGLGFKTYFDHATFEGATLVGTEFISASMVNCNLTDTFLTNAVFNKVELRGACFKGARGSQVRFHDSDLRGADLEESEFESYILENVQWDSSTKWPGGIVPDAAGEPYFEYF